MYFFSGSFSHENKGYADNELWMVLFPNNIREGNDAIDGKRLYIGGDQTIAGGGGDDQISFLGGVLPAEFVLGTSSGGKTTILGEAGADQLLITYAFVVGQWRPR